MILATSLPSSKPSLMHLDNKGSEQMISVVPPRSGTVCVCVELPGEEIRVWCSGSLTVKGKAGRSAAALLCTLSARNAEQNAMCEVFT